MHFHCEKQSDTHAIVDFRAKQWIIDIIKCCHWATTTNIGLLYPKVRNNIGGYSHWLPPYRGHPYIGGVSPASRRSWRQWWCGHGDLVPFADVMLRWCVGLENVCETVDEDCAVTQWSSWSPCSVTCGEGVAQRLRYFLNKDDMIRCQRETQQTQTCTADVLDCDAQSAGIHLLLLFLSSKYKICCSSSSSSSSICCVLEEARWCMASRTLYTVFVYLWWLAQPYLSSSHFSLWGLQPWPLPSSDLFPPLCHCVTSFSEQSISAWYFSKNLALATTVFLYQYVLKPFICSMVCPRHSKKSSKTPYFESFLFLSILTP